MSRAPAPWAGSSAARSGRGAIGADHVVGSIGQVLTGAAPGRRSDREITLFKSLGMVAEELVAADFVLRGAEARGLGSVVEF